MELRIADDSLKQQVIDLWKYCFYDADPYLSWYFEKMYRNENTLVALEDGKLAAALQIKEMELVMRKMPEKCHYLCGVSVSPWARGKGAGSQILKFADEISAKRGAKYNILIPALNGFYEKNGYVRCAEKTQYTCNPKILRTPKSDLNLKIAQQKDVPCMLEIYQKYTSAFDGYINRDMDIMKNMLDMYSLFTGGGVVFGESGYILYYIENRVMYIDEAVCTDEKSALAVLGFIAAHSSQIDLVHLRAGEGDIFSILLNTLDVECKKIHNIVIKPLYDEPTDIRLKIGKIDSATARMAGILCDDNISACRNFINILQ